MQNNIPVELLQYIFILLSPCTDLLTVLKVCKHWREVGLDVLKQRKNMTLSAFKFKSPLSWFAPRFNFDYCKYPVPSKRFGSSIVLHKKSVYVFGGATRELTAFNDLWVYDLCTSIWKRLIGKGDFPTPRAHAKGGFVGNNLYFYGGCQSYHKPGLEHTGRMDWLTELNSFDPLTTCWSRISLCHAVNMNPDMLPTIAGQSGCFLPVGGYNEPSLLILFGGMAQIHGSCLNDVYIISPENGSWIELFETKEQDNSLPCPAGRCGHSACTLDSNRMLLLFGNLDSPLASSFEVSSSQQHQEMNNFQFDLLNDSQVSTEYRGRPAGDIWILMRYPPQPHQTWSTAEWCWTQVHFSTSLLNGPPPIDFYHNIAICISSQEVNNNNTNKMNLSFDDIDDSNSICLADECFPKHKHNNSKTFNIIVISQSTQTILDESTKQRRSWQRIKMNSDIYNSIQTTESGTNLNLFTNDESQQLYLVSEQNSLNHTLPELDLGIKSIGRATNRRARRLEALAQQERRLFGSFRDVIGPNGGGLRPSNNYGPFPSLPSSGPFTHFTQPPTRPLAVYSLAINEASCSENCEFRMMDDKQRLEGIWLVPSKSNYRDLVFGPQECLGYACAFGYGCLFLFGGLTDSDDFPTCPPNNNNEEMANLNESHRFHQHQPPSSVSANQQFAFVQNSNESSPNHGRLVPRSNPSMTINNKNNNNYYYNNVSTNKMAQFYVLRARSLAGTLI